MTEHEGNVATTAGRVWRLPEERVDVGEDIVADDMAFEEASRRRRREAFAALEQLN